MLIGKRVGERYKILSANWRWRDEPCIFST